MPVDTSIKQPFGFSLNNFTNQRANDFQQIGSKGLPCHIVKIGPEIDVVTVAFDMKSGWTMPQRKIPVAFSPYSRDALVVGDKGYASPADYALGGNSGLGGQIADSNPRGNLTPLVFHPISKTQNEKRDNDRYVVTGGKNGVQIIQGLQPQSQQQSQPQGQQATTPSAQAFKAPQMAPGARRYRTRRMIPGKGFYGLSAAPRAAATPSNGSTSPQPQQPQQQSATAGTNMSQMTIDNKGVITHSSADNKHQVIVDQGNTKVALNVPATGSKDFVYLGGTGKQEELYAPVMTTKGPSTNVKAKWKKVDDN
jgi:hypothetical protein